MESFIKTYRLVTILGYVQVAMVAQSNGQVSLHKLPYVKVQGMATLSSWEGN